MFESHAGIIRELMGLILPETIIVWSLNYLSAAISLEQFTYNSDMAKTLDLERILHRQGFGTRKMCRILIINEEVTVNGELCDDPDAKFALDDNLHFTVQGEPWQWPSLPNRF